jgi:vacuolar protein sorting-associated protein 29
MVRGRFEAYEHEGRYQLNPGSATGAYVTSSSFSAAAPESMEANAILPPSPTPSFVLLDIQGYVLVSYVYTLVDQEVKVAKYEVRCQ